MRHAVMRPTQAREQLRVERHSSASRVRHVLRRHLHAARFDLAQAFLLVRREEDDIGARRAARR